jgi:hypothetical protein
MALCGLRGETNGNEQGVESKTRMLLTSSLLQALCKNHRPLPRSGGLTSPSLGRAKDSG